VRRYELGYALQNGLSFLQSVRLLGRDGVRWEDDPTKGLPPITFAYSTAPITQAANIAMTSPPVVQVGQASVDLVDINGDALPDIVHSDPSDGYRFFINRGRGHWDATPIYPVQSPSVQLATDGVQVADADGDGYADLLAKIGSAASSFYYFPNKGGSAWELNSRVDFATSPNFSYEDPDVQLVDLDNDRRVDVLRTTSSAYYIYFNSPSGWSSGPNRITEPLAYGAPLTFDDPRVKLADMNGDRLQDMVFVMDEQVAYFPSKGNGDFDAAVTMSNSPSLSGRSGITQLADVNGDGLTDLLRVDRFAVSVWLNQASAGFAEEVVLTDVPEYIAGETNLRLADMNGDGDTDLLYAAQPSTSDSPYRYLDFNGDTQSNLLTRIDNGLGRVIAFTYRTSTNYYVDDWNAGGQWTQRSPVAVPVVSRSTVTDKLSGAVYATEYSYRNAYYDGAEKTFRGFALAEQKDIGDATAPTQVTQLVFDTGKDNESRKGLLLQKDIVGEGGTCGANSLAAARMLAMRTTSTDEFSAWIADQPFLRDLRVLRGSNPAAPTVATVNNCYNRTLNQIHTKTLLSGSDGRVVSFSTISQTDVLHFENTLAPRRAQQTKTYDDYGNTLQENDFGEVAADGGNRALGNDERLMIYTYAYSPTAWIMDRVSGVKQTDLAGNVVSEQRNYYDGAAYVGLPLGQIAQGKLTRQQGHTGPNGGNQWLNVQRFKYDPYGNVIGRMDPNGVLDANGNPDASGHWAEASFDSAFHAYPISERIYTGNGKALAMTADYDLGLGVITRAVDFNGNATSFSYDGLARLSAITKPGDTLALPTQMFTYTLGHGLSAIETASRETSGMGEVFRAVSYVDGLGRPLQTRGEGEDGSVVVKEGVRFNERGGIGEQWLPYFALTPTLSYVAPEAAQPKTTLSYDPLLRPVQLTHPDNTFTKTVFAPLAEAQFDEEDNAPASSHFNTPMSYRYDGLGRLVQVLERHAGAVYTTTYGYDLLDNLTVITDTLGNVKKQSFKIAIRYFAILD
jgi:YD repeat-containing protein